jgi:hypothetical protein
MQSAVGNIPTDSFQFTLGSGLGNVYVNAIIFGTSGISMATGGSLRFSSGDSINWRNNANNADIAFTKTGAANGNIPADTFITGGGSGIAATFFSQGNAADAIVGIFRLPSGGAINWRNTANSADLGILKTAADEFQISGAGFRPSNVLFANLGTPASGVFIYCSDCTIANPCAGAGTGALAKRLNGVWVCN